MGNKIHWDLYTDCDDLFVNLNFYYKHQTKDPNSDCILWTGGTHRQGYGMVGGIRKADNKRIMTVAHRIAARVKWKRAIATNELVIHTCSNVLCQNPDHLIIGDWRKKSEVMWANGRGPKEALKHRHYGREVKQNRSYRYSEKEIAWIRDADTLDIAQRYNITRVRAGHLRWSMRKHFKWLPWEEKK